MKKTRKIWPVFLLLSLLFVLPLKAQQQNQDFDRWDPTDDDMKTGPAVGETIPEFEATDQNGSLIHFQDIAGPNGAVILFHRSADW